MPADPTDEAVKVLGKLLAEAPEQGEWEWDEHCEGVAMYVLSKIPTDVLARVVAGRPDQPTQTTTVGMPVLIDGTPSDVGEWCDREYHAAPDAYCSRRVLLLDISAHTDPHTPNQGETP